MTGAEAIFTPEQLAEIAAYHRPWYLWAALSHPVNLLWFAVLLRFLVGPLYRLAERTAAALDRRLSFLRRAPVTRVVARALERLWGEPGWGVALLFAFYDYLLGTAVFFPLDVYLSYLNEHAYGLSRYTPGAFAWDQLKSFLLYVIAVSALAFGLFGLARRVKRWWLLLGAPLALLLVVSAALDPFRGQVYFDRKPLPEGPLRTQISALMAKAGVDFSDVVVEETSKATVRVQAYFAGQGTTRTIVLNDSLLKEFSDDEVLAAVAHESGHVHEPRWPAWLLSALGLLAFLFAVDRLFRLSARKGWFGTTRYADIRTLPLIALLFYVATSLIHPVTAIVSRERERDADRFALRLTGDPEAFKRMLIKAARVNKMDPHPPRWITWLGQSHPPISERLALVDGGSWKKPAAGRSPFPAARPARPLRRQPPPEGSPEILRRLARPDPGGCCT